MKALGCWQRRTLALGGQRPSESWPETIARSIVSGELGKAARVCDHRDRPPSGDLVATKRGSPHYDEEVK